MQFFFGFRFLVPKQETSKKELHESLMGIVVRRFTPEPVRGRGIAFLTTEPLELEKL